MAHDQLETPGTVYHWLQMLSVGDGAARPDRPELVLASASPRRLEILRTVGLEPMVASADVDESPLPGEKPTELVERLALAKAQTVARRLAASSPLGRRGADRLVIGADTVIDLEGTSLGKPIDELDARRMLQDLSGRIHTVVTGVAVSGVLNGREVETSATEATEVALRNLSAAEIDWYVGTSEPEGKAGAYAIQGLGSLLVERIEGSHQGVVGLPLPVLDRLLAGLGCSLREMIAP